MVLTILFTTGEYLIAESISLGSNTSESMILIKEESKMGICEKTDPEMNNDKITEIDKEILLISNIF